MVPCYNAERFVLNAIQSVLSQTYSEIELILIDDGSNDATFDIIRTFYAAPRVMCRSGPNRGASVARNTGVDMARGEFIQFLDADDLLRPHAIEERVDTLIRTKGDVAYSGWQRWREDHKGQFRAAEVVMKTIEEVHPDPEIATFTSFWAPPATLLYRREIVDRIGRWHPDLPVIQDARFLQDAAHHGARFVHVPEVLADYREHRRGSLSKQSTFAVHLDILTNAVEIEERWRRLHDSLTGDQMAALIGAYHHCAVNLFESDPILFGRACARLQDLGASSDPMVRLWHSCQRWGYARIRATRAPMRAGRTALGLAKRPLRDAIRSWTRRGVAVEVLP